MPEQAEGIEQTKENPDTLVVELGIEQMPAIIGGIEPLGKVELPTVASN